MEFSATHFSTLFLRQQSALQRAGISLPINLPAGVLQFWVTFLFRCFLVKWEGKAPAEPNLSANREVGKSGKIANGE